MSLDRMIGNFLHDALGGGVGGSLARGLSSKKTRKKIGKSMGGMGGSALKLGGMAALGALAYKAYQSHMAGQQAGGMPSPRTTAPPSTQHADFADFGAPSATAAGGHPAAPPPPPPMPATPVALQAAHDPLPLPPPDSAFNHEAEDEATTNDRAFLMLRAMIAAAAADGQIDEAEKARITEGVQEAGLSKEQRSALARDLAAPASIATLATACTGPEMGAEMYAASLMAIEVDHIGETIHLKALSAALGLEDGMVNAIHTQLGRPVA